MSISRHLKSLLGLRPEMSWSFYLLDFVYRKLFRHNARVKWALHHTATIHCPEGLSKGIGTYPGDSPGVYINASNGIYVGDFSNLGPNVGLISGNHDPLDNEVMLPARSIHIGSFCWLGMGAVVLPGVRLGNFTVVGAGAIVTHSFEEGHCVLAGNPARIIRTLSKEACDARARRRYEANAVPA
ncbi:MAG: acyltransferase [Bacteroidetes bacterium]|nr:acyltransferase [Bacteroidota bacterium]MBS1628909.1 acyltransferase [Bacteroidota bacterium]